MFSGSTGGNTGPNDRWKLNSTTDWRHNGTNWVQVGSTGGRNVENRSDVESYVHEGFVAHYFE